MAAVVASIPAPDGGNPSSSSSSSSSSALSPRVIAACAAALRRLREGELTDAEIRRSPFRHVLGAVRAARADILRRPRTGAVYAKTTSELEARHVLLWRPPQRRRPLPKQAHHPQRHTPSYAAGNLAFVPLARSASESSLRDLRDVVAAPPAPGRPVLDSVAVSPRPADPFGRPSHYDPVASSLGAGASARDDVDPGLSYALPRRRRGLFAAGVHGAGYDDTVQQQHVPPRPPPPPGNFHARVGSLSTARSAAMARSQSRVFVPRFLAALLDLEDCAATRLYLRRPELFARLADFLVMPNPAYFGDDPDDADSSLNFAAGESAKRAAAVATSRGLGFSLVAWWIHPQLQKRSRFYACHRDLRVPSRMRRSASAPKSDGSASKGAPAPSRDASADRGPGIAVADVLASAADAVPYLYDVSDLVRAADDDPPTAAAAAHIVMLERLKAGVARHLAAVYGVYGLDDDAAYFHRQHAMWSDRDRAWALTLHLHISVKRARTPACYCHSVSLTDLIARLRRRMMANDDDDEAAAEEAVVVPGGDFEILNVPDDPADAWRCRDCLARSGFLISDPLTPADLAFDDLVGCVPFVPASSTKKKQNPS